MENVELLIPLAEIAGVFVAFGALIASRSAGTADLFDVGGVLLVMTQGAAVIITALTPLAISRYGVDGHGLWLASSILFLVVFFGSDELLKRLSPERRAMLAAWPLRTRARMEIVAAIVWGPMIIGLIVIVLGLLPDQEPALYFTAVALNLVMAILILLVVVTGQARPKAAPDQVSETAAEGTTA